MIYKGPFENLEIPRNAFDLSTEFIKKWVLPFYSERISDADNSKITLFANAAKEIEPGEISNLLGDFNWRSRIAGAYFSAIRNDKSFEDTIGKLLLKSEVTLAGFGYCLALATFGTAKSRDYLASYLHYYLERMDLHFDQTVVFFALEFVDKELASELLTKYKDFLSDKPDLNLGRMRSIFHENILAIRRIQRALES